LNIPKETNLMQLRSG